MFGLGWTELLVIGVVALIVIGPKDLPVMMNRMGKAVSAIRKMGTSSSARSTRRPGSTKSVTCGNLSPNR